MKPVALNSTRSRALGIAFRRSLGMGWPEIALIGVVAIVVFGPDKLPDLAKQAGRMVRKLRDFQELGHEVIFVVGDYTALVGDPHTVAGLSRPASPSLHLSPIEGES